LLQERTHIELLDGAADTHDADVAVSTVVRLCSLHHLPAAVSDNSNPLVQAASVEDRIKTMKRHKAAREVHTMRNWLKAAGRIHDFTGYDSADEGDGVAGDTRTAKAERRRARREAHEDWVAPKLVIAPDGTHIMVRTCTHRCHMLCADARARSAGRRLRWLPGTG